MISRDMIDETVSKIEHLSEQGRVKEAHNLLLFLEDHAPDLPELASLRDEIARAKARHQSRRSMVLAMPGFLQDERVRGFIVDRLIGVGCALVLYLAIRNPVLPGGFLLLDWLFNTRQRLNATRILFTGMGTLLIWIAFAVLVIATVD